jgi:hypothetical protein
MRMKDDHMRNGQLKACSGRLPENITADSAYGSEENYAYLDQEKAGKPAC